MMAAPDPVSALDEVFAGCGWGDGGPDPFRRLRAGVLVEMCDRLSAAAAAGSLSAAWLLKAVREASERPVGLVWEAESPDNAERLYLPVLARQGSIVETGGTLFRVVEVDGPPEDAKLLLQRWEPGTGDLDGLPVWVPAGDVEWVVDVPFDPSTAARPVFAHRETIAHPDCPVDAPVHMLIEGENYHALQALLATHRGKIDLIYIDPPYNTGNRDFAYNDRYLDTGDEFRHSAWLRFMQRRLRLAKELLSPTGVLIVAIGDDEHHQLRLLLDQVFGAANYLADVTWQGRVKNDRAFTGGGADFMLLYGKDRKALESAGIRWSERKPGVAELLHVARGAFSQAAADGAEPAAAAEAATKVLRQWVAEHKNEYPGGVLSYRTVDEHGQVYRAGPLDSPNPRPNLTFDVFHPVTGKAIPTPKNGWRVSRDLLAQMNADGLVLWGKDHTTGIRRKLVLTDESEGVPAPTFTADRGTATKQLRTMIGDTGFTNPKPHDVLMTWFRMVSAPHATILDFFAGSGTTLHAVAQLNEADGGSRRCILVTNNSANVGKRFVPDGGPDGICQKVTIPRTRAILETGYAKVAPIMQRCDVSTIGYDRGHGRAGG
jgi:hypothetical protein